MSKREEVQMQREAFRAGADFRYREMRRSSFGDYGRSSVKEAEQRYPLTETRPRVVILPNGLWYRIVAGELQVEQRNGWEKSSTYSLEAMSTYAQLLELKANPTEEVPL